ncbi:hypothetical protein PABG_12290 [Paracoccidioides brasiliensis Pb03]|nr:hypothetical protein PABG_12290 [Paracoccidioides brasiliensis Pb03]
MPIPMRSLSLREPRIRQKPAGLDREAIPEAQRPRTIEARSNTASSATSSASAPPRNSKLPSYTQPVSGLPQPATTAATAATAATSAAAAAPTTTSHGGREDSGGNGGDSALAARRRSFLPQRGSWQKGAGSVSSGRLQPQLQDTELQRLRGADVQEVQTPATAIHPPVPGRSTDGPAQLPDLSEQTAPPLSSSKLSLSKLARPTASSMNYHAGGTTGRLERPGSANASKLDSSKSQDAPINRFERPASSSTTNCQLSRSQSVHIARMERPSSANTTTSQMSRPQSRPTPRLERRERSGSVNTNQPKPEPPKPQTTNATRLERSASLRQPMVVSRVAKTNHSRHKSQIVSTTKGHTSSSVKQSDGNTTTATTSTTPSSKAAKPQFSTFQQHYSPKRGLKTKPPIPIASASSTSVTETGPGTDPSSHTNLQITALQTELLQLHLLHADSLHARLEWECSAKNKLRKQHQSVVSKYHTLLAQEQGAQRYVNKLALDRLAEDIQVNRNNRGHNSHSHYDFAEQIQALSRVVQDVAVLTDVRGGRHVDCIRVFERWFEHVERVRRGRSGSGRGKGTQNGNAYQKLAVDGNANGNDGDDDVEDAYSDNAATTCDFIDPLSSKWKEEVAALSAKLVLCARELDCLEVDVRGDGQDKGKYPPSSALIRTVRGHKLLLRSMIEELEIVSAIEVDVEVLERLWVSKAVDRLGPASVSANAGGGGGAAAAAAERRRRQPVWALA